MLVQPLDTLAVLQEIMDRRVYLDGRLTFYCLACFDRLADLLPDPRIHAALALARRSCWSGSLGVDLVMADARRVAEELCLKHRAAPDRKLLLDTAIQVGLFMQRSDRLPIASQLTSILCELGRAEGLNAVFAEIVGDPNRQLHVEPGWCAHDDSQPRRLAFRARLAMGRGEAAGELFAELRLALRDAGCNNSEMLSHLAEPWHDRDCWALAAVLAPQGKGRGLEY